MLRNYKSNLKIKFSIDIDSGTKIKLQDKIIITLIHLAIALFIYILMFCVMTYNLWIILSILLGNSVGYAIFGFSGKTTLRNAEQLGCCHAG